MSSIRIHKSLHIEQPTILEEAAVTSAGYISNERSVLLESVTYGQQREFYFRARKLPEETSSRRVLRRSEDNGRSWTQVTPWVSYVPLANKRRLQRWFPMYVLNRRTGTLLELVMAWEDIEGLVPWDPQNPAPRTGRIWQRFSADGGKTWSAERQLILPGPEYNANHWGPDLEYGKNSGYVIDEPVYLDDERFMIPFCRTNLGEPSGVDWCSILFGRWRPDGGVEWDMSASVTIPWPRSGTGADEGSASLLSTGELLMTMRVMIGREEEQKGATGARYFVVSKDGGRTWSDPEPFRFADGGIVPIPACLANVFRSSRTGRLYLISNILDQPACGGDPRYPLRIAEIDETTLRIRRESMVAIETRDESYGQPETIRFSNWAKYEDRETGNLVLLMTACPGNVGRHETCGVPPHCYRYDIIFSE